MTPDISLFLGVSVGFSQIEGEPDTALVHAEQAKLIAQQLEKIELKATSGQLQRPRKLPKRIPYSDTDENKAPRVHALGAFVFIESHYNARSTR
ncbi:MAG: hypothetical protein VX212_14080 [Pseudomonadota bacterium]|nr:hypothetical protein [Pseudomonadota bacterium]